MPVKSKSQWRAIWSQEGKGNISKSKADEMVSGVNYSKLPERISKRKTNRKSSRTIRRIGRR